MDLVTVLRTGNPALIALAKSLLSEAAIEYTTRGESVQNLFGFGQLATPFDIVAGPVEFQVREQDAQRAGELLSGLEDPAR